MRRVLGFFVRLLFFCTDIKEWKKELLNFFYLLMSRMDRLGPSQFQGVHMKDIPIVEDLLLLKTFLYDIDFVEGKI